ncbi:mechanosensitive ion channel [Sphingobacterium shayense]|uniref:mechanosensitive ion channel family protein n=1 Tax=Sphingobacterium shayense TaxID=626343 RepID=UPI001556BD5F|nr:mechanosensitive ion channel domain-containing protein [Sphingobacterium shayense]NQD72288.1 mechanosensitive ion channel [Sphingobacterium shayense]
MSIINSIKISSTETSTTYNWVFEKITNAGLDGKITNILTSAILLLGATILLIIVDYVTRKILRTVFIRLIKKTTTTWDDYFIENKVIKHFSHLIPLLLAHQILPEIFIGFPAFSVILSKILMILLIITVLAIINGILKTSRDILKTSNAFIDKPVDSYLQVIQIFLYFICGTLIFSIMTGNSPWSFLVSLGAASAILMLVFKDTILGFVASIQVSANDSVRVGDWVEMSKYGADGTVLQINLNNVKIQNFDKTIVAIPTFTLLSDSFKNYRGMEQSGGRRIKRAINIKISTIRYLDEKEINALRKIQLLAPFIAQRQKEIAEFNSKNNADPTVLVNGRRMTNIGLFRTYIELFAKNNPNIHQEMTMMVRQLAPTEHGLPLELYMFTSDTQWVFYENAMADIFDHLFAAIKYFDLEVFERPGSNDIHEFIKNQDPYVKKLTTEQQTF